MIGSLERAHVGAHRVQPLDGILDPHRQLEEHQSELVAEPIRLVERAQIHRHQRANHDTVDGIAAAHKVRAQRAGHRRKEHIVDRGAKRLADRLDLVERERIGPCDAFGDTGFALEPRRRVFAHQGELGELGC